MPRGSTCLIFLAGYAISAVLASCEPGGASGPDSPATGALPAATAAAATTIAPVAPEEGQLVVYSGRSQSLVEPIIEAFEAESGIDVAVRWASTAELAATLLEEGDRSAADVFFAQDPGGLGAVESLLADLPADLLDRVDSSFRDVDGRWIGVNGRVRTVVYNTDRVAEADMPGGIEGFSDPAWRNRIGWAPTNASFQAMVTGMRASWGEEATREWLRAIEQNDPEAYDGNSAIVAAVGSGEVDIGFVNHYYLHRFLAEEGPEFPARNHFLAEGGPGTLLLVAGAGIMASSARPSAAESFVRFLLSDTTQALFVTETNEYPLVAAIDGPTDLPPLGDLNAMTVDVSDLADTEGTVRMLREERILP